MKKNELDLAIPERLSVYEDGKTRAKSIAIPFQFPDNTNGLVIISRLSRGAWQPNVEKVVVTFKDEHGDSPAA